MQNSKVVFTFYVLDRKYSFRAIWSKKSTLSDLAEIVYKDLFEYAECDFSFFFFLFFFSLSSEILILGEFGSKNQNCYFLSANLSKVAAKEFSGSANTSV